MEFSPANHSAHKTVVIDDPGIDLGEQAGVSLHEGVERGDDVGVGATGGPHQHGDDWL